MVFMMNHYNLLSRSESWGFTAIYTTDDESHTSISQYSKCSGDFSEGGFKTLGSCKGRFLIIARTGSGTSWYNVFDISEVRVYSVPNLLEGATMIKAPTSKDLSFSADNLVENQETRSGR